MADSTVYHLGGSDGESISTKRRTGWVALTDMGRNTTIRRLNARYSSPSDNLSAKIYANGDNSNSSEVWSGTLASNNTGNKYKSIAVGRRANSIMVEVETSTSTNTTLEINKLEVEVDA